MSRLFNPDVMNNVSAKLEGWPVTILSIASEMFTMLGLQCLLELTSAMGD